MSLKRRRGQPLTYAGKITQAFCWSFDRAPTENDYHNFERGDFWIHTIGSGFPFTYDLWQLADKKRSRAQWIKFGGSGGELITVSGDNNVTVNPDANNNIRLFGDGTVTVTEDPVNNRMQWSAPGSGAVFTVQTTDAVKTVIFNNAVAASQVVMIQGFILMGQDDYTAGFSGTFFGAARKPAVGATVLIGTPVTNWTHDFPGVPRIDVEINGDSIELNVTGTAATTMNWRAVVALQIEQT